MTAPCRASALPFALCALLLAGAAFAEDFPSTVTGRFDALDVNRDGVLSKYEYDSEAAFAVMDGDQDNSISAAELQEILGPQQDGTPSAADRIRVADVDGDGALDDEELRRRGEMRFQWMDANKDGNVDLPELRAAFGVRTFGP